VSIKESEKQHNFTNKAYQEAMKVYYKAFVRRSDKSKSQKDMAEKYFGENVYTFMWGPSEFTATGNLLNYDRLKELTQIKLPTLLTAGEFDEARPASVRYFTSLIPDAQFQLIPQAAHSTMQDNPKEYNRILREFLRKLDGMPVKD
jgi:proline iminopeptidase